MRKLLFLIPALLPGIFFPGENVPIDRLITNTKAALDKDPNDGRANYVMGRLYSRLFAEQREATVSRTAKDKDAVPVLFPDSPNYPPRDPKKALDAKARENALLSLKYYRRSVEILKDSDLGHFSLGWMLEQCSRFDPKLATEDEALVEYRKAYDLALPKDSKVPYVAPFEQLIAQEAGQAIIAILSKQPTLRNKAEIFLIQRNVDSLSKKGRAITPVIFACDGSGELVSRQTTAFDMDGFDLGYQWNWVTPSACLLAWDPDHSGRITSGRQLFGTVTFQMFWRNGYEPLAALDDNGDGKLTGAELKGISVWRDLNSNGISDPGEVVPVENFGVIEIGVRGTDRIEDGIRFADGRTTASIDWVPVGRKR